MIYAVCSSIVLQTGSVNTTFANHVIARNSTNELVITNSSGALSTLTFNGIVGYNTRDGKITVNTTDTSDAVVFANKIRADTIVKNGNGSLTIKYASADYKGDFLFNGGTVIVANSLIFGNANNATFNTSVFRLGGGGVKTAASTVTLDPSITTFSVAGAAGLTLGAGTFALTLQDQLTAGTVINFTGTPDTAATLPETSPVLAHAATATAANEVVPANGYLVSTLDARNDTTGTGTNVLGTGKWLIGEDTDTPSLSLTLGASTAVTTPWTLNAATLCVTTNTGAVESAPSLAGAGTLAPGMHNISVAGTAVQTSGYYNVLRIDGEISGAGGLQLGASFAPDTANWRGRLYLGAANTYSGGTTLDLRDFYIYLGADNALGTGPITLTRSAAGSAAGILASDTTGTDGIRTLDNDIIFSAPYNGDLLLYRMRPVSYTHLTLPTKRIV